jgi:hypothetical protein
MLAYVFWHWSVAGTPQSQYEESLRRFHNALTSHPAEGLRGSAAFRIAGARWLAQARAYEDWYLVNDFTSLGLLNDAAVSGQRKPPHDDAARLAAGGTAGIYKLAAGDANFYAFRFAVWMTKPAGTSYEQFFNEASGWTKTGAALWQRQMTLGPATEFCLQSAESIAVPERFAPLRIPLALVTTSQS